MECGAKIAMPMAIRLTSLSHRIPKCTVLRIQFPNLICPHYPRLPPYPTPFFPHSPPFYPPQQYTVTHVSQCIPNLFCGFHADGLTH